MDIERLVKDDLMSGTVYIRTVSLLSIFLIKFKTMGHFGRRSIYSTLDICPRPARKRTNVPLH